MGGPCFLTATAAWSFHSLLSSSSSLETCIQRRGRPWPLFKIQIFLRAREELSCRRQQTVFWQGFLCERTVLNSPAQKGTGLVGTGPHHGARLP